MSHWLMKSEPATYSIDDLKKKNGPDVWEGCRNYTVRNFFRDSMKVGDEAFFYHSSCPVPGIVGTMKIVSEVYADPTQFDPKSHYYDPKSPADNPRWTTRDVQFERKFARVVTLDELRNTPGLEDMWVLRRGMRFSVMPVTDAEWKTVLALPGI
jgi:predicted RNA-binding protein with PUA-like domain